MLASFMHVLFLAALREASASTARRLTPVPPLRRCSTSIRTLTLPMGRQTLPLPASIQHDGLIETDGVKRRWSCQLRACSVLLLDTLH
jgi:hypothetical protein